MRARGPRWPFPRGAWFDGRSNGELLGSVGLAAGDQLEVKVRDYEGRAQGRELPRVEIAYALDETTADAGSAGGRYLRAQHVGATDGHFSWHAQAEGKPGGRLQGTLCHLCGRPQEECTAGCPIGAGGVEHIDIWRVVDPRDLETLEAEYHLAPRAAGGLRGEPAAKRARKEEPSAALARSDAEVAGLERALEDPALDGRLAQLGQRLRGSTGGGSGARAVAKNAAMPGAARALAQRVQEHTAAGSGARVSAALAGRERLAAMLTATLLGGEDGSELNDEGSGALDRDTNQGANVRRDLFQRIAKQRPGVLLENGPAHLRSQFTQLLADPSQADPLGPCVTQHLNMVFFVAHPPRTLDVDEARALRTLGEAIDGLLRGQVVEVSDLLTQEFKARTMALRDGHWRSARRLTLTPSESLPAGASRDEEAAAERAEAREMKVAELKRRLADKKALLSGQGFGQEPSPAWGGAAPAGHSLAEARPQSPAATPVAGSAAALRILASRAPAGLTWKESKVANPRRPDESRRDWKSRLEEKRQQVEDEELLQAAGADFQVPDWHEVVAARDITHGGEEVSRALPLTLGGAMPGLPPRGVAASVRALDIADERVAGWLADPTLALLPKAEWPEEVPRAAIQASSKAEWHRIGAKLVELGLAVPIADDPIFKVGNRKVLAGSFGVAKGGTPTPGHDVAQRLIINMVPANSYQRTMRDDIGTISASKDRPLPLRATELEQAWVQYYMDDWDHGEIVQSSRLNELGGTLSEVQAEQRAAYKRGGIRVAEGKAKHRELVLERMRAGLDGMVGRVGVTVEKQLLLLALVMWVMGQPQVTVKAMLVVLGRCVRVAEFRRPFMGFLNECWAAGQWRYPQAVPSVMCGELLVFCMALPLAFTDLRAKIDTGVIATDASEQAGGICYSAGLTARGVQAATGEGGLCEEAVHTTFAAPQMVRWRPRVILVELFAGAAAAAVAAHRLPMSVAAHLCSEVEPAARRLVRRRWPGVIELGNIEALDLERFTRMLEGFRRDADWVFIIAGSPCQVAALIEASKRVFGTHVDWFVENVFSMGAEARGQFSQALGVTPVLFEAKDFTRVKSEGISQYTKVEVSVERAAADLWPLPGWRLDDPEVDLPCFTRPVPRRHPPLRPVGLERASPTALARWATDQHRYQVNKYEDALCLQVGEREPNWNIDADFKTPGYRHATAERGLIVDFLRIADRGGTDVRLDCGALYRARAWPRSALRTSLWAWRIAKSFRWQRPAHISELELEAAVAGARWRCRDVAKHGCRYLHLLDAHAVAAVCTKCRSSAWRLQPGIRRFNALTLATNCYSMYGYCDTDDMPADVRRVAAKALARRTAARSRPLRELAGTPLARKRYQEAVDSVFDWWVEQKREVQSAAQADMGLVDYIEGRWAAGGSLLDVNCAIAGMCHHFPPLRGRLRESWRLARTWQRAEPAGRALPIAPLIALAFSGGFLTAGVPAAAAILLAAYDTYLRTGEIMALRWHDITMYENSGSAMIRLRDTKSQHQTGAGEFVMVRSQTAVALLLKARELAGTASRCEEPAIGMPPAAFQRVFAEIRLCLQLEDQRLTLYSWRRGGASADFRSHGSMETTLLRGRWASVRTARLYVQDAVAEATTLALLPDQRAACLHLASRVR
ncbi:unnamed protein product [Prorocentrum cordatum]|uniref:RNA-directed RNA polymerase n=1 Tax=Prorocentrum cordatum TaxID=2364126 RepID=A0ABN9QSC9_9DINO|nr:unnamed protein product [Polarella glacialis]